MSRPKTLAMAAKAAGFKWDDYCSCYHDKRGEIWTPYDDDGQALRLAVQLKLDVSIGDQVQVALWIGERLERFESLPDEDLQTATRRCIVEAAAEAGRNKP